MDMSRITCRVLDTDIELVSHARLRFEHLLQRSPWKHDLN